MLILPANLTRTTPRLVRTGDKISERSHFRQTRAARHSSTKQVRRHIWAYDTAEEKSDEVVGYKRTTSLSTQLKRWVALGGMDPGAPGLARADAIADTGKLSLAHATHQIMCVRALASTRAMGLP